MTAPNGHLLHYTTSADVLASIVEHGFLLVPNKRNLINALLGADVFGDREPQQFGMVSFTQLPFEVSAAHRRQFGSYGIAMSWEWAQANDAQRVVYVDTHGPTVESLAWLFRYAKQELEDAAGGDPGTMALENAAVASFAKSTLWSHMLRLYEFMEPEANSTQVEWRIVSAVPHYHQATERSALIQGLLTEAKLWRTGSIRFEPNDVLAFVCPRESRSSLRSLLPERFREIPLLTYRARPSQAKLQRLRESAMWARRVRERRVEVLKPPPRGTSWLWINSDGAFQLPNAEYIRGAHLHQDELRSAAGVVIQYEDPFGHLCDLVMDAESSFRLFEILKVFRRSSGLHPSNILPPRLRPRDILIGRMRIGMAPLNPRRTG